MEPRVDSVSFANTAGEVQQYNETEGNAEVDNPPVVTVEPKEEDKNMGLVVERRAKKFIQEVRKSSEIEMEIERKQEEYQFKLFTGIYHSAKRYARRAWNALSDSYKQYQKMLAENPNAANLYYTTSLDPYNNPFMY